MSERNRWERLATADPYWAVLVEERYRADRLDDEARREFFASGEREVAATLAQARALAGATERPHRSLDFGCGVGRLTLPLARASDSAVGLDISEKMLEEARRNAERAGVGNVEFRETDWLFSGRDVGEFDFIHSSIVFQHIPPKTGLRIADAMLRRLKVGGAGALHFTYARRASLLRRVVNRARRWFRPVDLAVRLVRGEPLGEPFIPMNAYDLAQIFALLQQRGCGQVSALLTDHGGHLGAMLLFRKER